MNTKLILAASAVFFATGAAVTPSFAQTESSERGMTIERAMEASERMFARLDTDNDGMISQAEIDARPGNRMRGDEDGEERGKGKGKGKGKDKGEGKNKGARLVHLFLGEDGLVDGMTLDALQAQVTSSFDTFDTDASGVLTRQEIRAALKG